MSVPRRTSETTQ
uniref:Uncharacterized protein n=1 Tax=Anguilla anguilla TaxID=7936 RepID=A0A0E9UA55_ANGAN